MGIRRSRYTWMVPKGIDLVSNLLTQPFQHIFSLTLSCYIITTFDTYTFLHLFLRFAVIGPLLAILALVLLPVATVGFLLWILLNHFGASNIQPYRLTTPDEGDGKNSMFSSECPRRFTFMSANVICVPEFIVRINNVRNVYWRMKEIARRFLKQNRDLNIPNLLNHIQGENLIQDKLPEVDVMMLQEVSDKWANYSLVSSLTARYPYIIYDVGVHSFGTNCFLMGSGLFLASRYPVLAVNFHPYHNILHYGHLASIGVLTAKLDLGSVPGKDGEELRGVGYVSNTHTQAYQGKKLVIARQLTELQETVRQFISETHNPDKEVIIFSVVGGDFNFDNMSPGDRPTRIHPLFTEYEDPCRECEGEDKHWAVGTEHRQRQLSHPAVSNSTIFKHILMNKVERRKFIIDADILEQTSDLMYSSPKIDPVTGELMEVMGGGGRRIDLLLLRAGDRVRFASFWFLTIISSLSDHLPVAMMVERIDEDQRWKEQERREWEYQLG
ncbi:hypothetical protein Pmani_021355 [Petrolisthes manimaculis]|uniref:sphingomyelin phosphodiesterase n=1 Tax=Petrolisthes manimaculis TaxID=1843537 RepID=A0AAE1PEB2_9EUCA|nr:hypothetical protein Pmani_021355 [Petrolisthes manimaculis]